MNGTEPEGRRGVSGGCWRVLGLGILMLAFSVGLFAQVKGLYYDGLGFEFRNVQNSGTDLRVEARYWSTHYSEWDIKWSGEWGIQSATGSLGACVFNGLLYCFFTTTDGKLQYVTVDTASQNKTGPTTIATGIDARGAAAAVLGDKIYVFVITSYALELFTSLDGKQYSYANRWDYNSPLGCLVEMMLDAVTFYPMGDSPAGILVVLNANNALPSKLRAVKYYPANDPANDLISVDVLPWPPVNPCLWARVTQGNLVMGTSAGYPTPGAKAPCLQFYGMTDDNGCDGQHLGRWEYNLATESWAFNEWDQGGHLYQLGVFPWFDTMDSASGMMRLSHIMDVQFRNTETWYINRSDWMVPQYNDPTYGWAGTPTATANATGTELQSLWTLVGVVLGPPPFPMNGATNACSTAEDAFAWVDYGKDTSTTVTTTSTASSTISVASESKIKGGIGQLTLDLSYAHAWTHGHGTSQTVSVSQDFQFGPCSEQVGSQGTHGWAIFNAPTLVTQWYKLYAYDYNSSTGHGTYLDQDIYATATGAAVQQTAYFDLANPSQGEYPNLFAGMTVYPNSTNIAGWHLAIPKWDNGGSNWSAIFGDNTSPQMPVLTLGIGDVVSYTESDTTTNSKGNSNSFGVQAGAKLNIEGFSEAVTVGYDGEWTTTTENESTITKNVSCALNVPIPPDTTGYVNSMTVQPFWLQAKTAQAPWIPTGYGGNLPWCVTWDVTQYNTVGGGTAGLSGPPASASGTIRVGGDQEKDTYKVAAGRLAWMDAEGAETALPMTAGQFDPAQGAAVSFNGHAFPADGTKGKWSRKSDVWKYKTREGVKADPFELDLDFAGMAWSFHGASKSLDHDLRVADGSVQVHLALQGKHSFTTWIEHEVQTKWSHEEKKAVWQPYGVHQVKGDYDSRTGAGTLMVKGHIPKKETRFGDVTIVVNGASVVFPLLGTEKFLDKFDRGGTVTYKAEDLLFEIDFGTGKWKASIEGNHFQSAMVPKGGAVRVQVLVGGEQTSDQTFQVQKHTTTLTFGG